MKKSLLIMIVTAFIGLLVFSVWTESDNPYYEKFLEYKKMAQAAYDEGDYDKATELSAEAQGYLTKAQEYRAQLVLRNKASRYLQYATDRITYIESSKLDKENPDVYQTAKANFDLAKKSFDDGEYAKCIEYSQSVLDNLADLKVAAADTTVKTDTSTTTTTADSAYATTSRSDVLPKYYVVKLIPGARESLWKIAGYDFVYGNPLKWPILYKANKSKLKYIDNPNYILPGMIIEIPSIAGETREGTYKK